MTTKIERCQPPPWSQLFQVQQSILSPTFRGFVILFFLSVLAFTLHSTFCGASTWSLTAHDGRNWTSFNYERLASLTPPLDTLHFIFHLMPPPGLGPHHSAKEGGKKKKARDPFSASIQWEGAWTLFGQPGCSSTRLPYVPYQAFCGTLLPPWGAFPSPCNQFSSFAMELRLLLFSWR